MLRLLSALALALAACAASFHIDSVQSANAEEGVEDGKLAPVESTSLWLQTEADLPQERIPAKEAIELQIISSRFDFLQKALEKIDLSLTTSLTIMGTLFPTGYDDPKEGLPIGEKLEALGRAPQLKSVSFQMASFYSSPWPESFQKSDSSSEIKLLELRVCKLKNDVAMNDLVPPAIAASIQKLKAHACDLEAKHFKKKLNTPRLLSLNLNDNRSLSFSETGFNLRSEEAIALDAEWTQIQLMDVLPSARLSSFIGRGDMLSLVTFTEEESESESLTQVQTNIASLDKIQLRGQTSQLGLAIFLREWTLNHNDKKTANVGLTIEAAKDDDVAKLASVTKELEATSGCIVQNVNIGALCEAGYDVTDWLCATIIGKATTHLQISEKINYRRLREQFDKHGSGLKKARFMSWTRPGEDDLPLWLPHLQEVEELLIWHIVSASALKGLTTLPRLKRASLTVASTLDDEFLEALCAFTSLKYLNVDGEREGPNLEGLQRLMKIRGLESLSVNASVSPADLKQLTIPATLQLVDFGLVGGALDERRSAMAALSKRFPDCCINAGVFLVYKDGKNLSDRRNPFR